MDGCLLSVYASSMLIPFIINNDFQTLSFLALSLFWVLVREHLLSVVFFHTSVFVCVLPDLI